MRLGVFLVTFLVGCGIAYAAIHTDMISFGSSELVSSREGRVVMRSTVNQQSSALEIRPTSGGVFPTTDSLSELTLYRTSGSTPMERFNISAMAASGFNDLGQYRFGVEAENGGILRPILFCFESPRGERANCRLKITTDGVFVNDAKGTDEQKWIEL